MKHFLVHINGTDEILSCNLVSASNIGHLEEQIAESFGYEENPKLNSFNIMPFDIKDFDINDYMVLDITELATTDKEYLRIYESWSKYANDSIPDGTKDRPAWDIWNDVTSIVADSFINANLINWS